MTDVVFYSQGREVAVAIGNPQDAEELADDLEMAFLEGRMSVNDDGGLAVLIPDPDEEDTYYKLNMTSRDGTMSVWAQGSDGEKVEYGVGDGWEDEDRVGYFGIPVDGGEARERGSVNFNAGDGSEGEPGAAPWSGEKEDGGGFFGFSRKMKR